MSRSTAASAAAKIAARQTTGAVPSPCVATAVRRALARAGSGVALATLLAPAAFAQQAAGESRATEANRLDDVTVVGVRQRFQAVEASTATGFELAVLDTPQALSVMTADMLETTGADTVKEMLRYVPSMSSYENFGGFVDKYQARGFRIDQVRGNRVNGISVFNLNLDPRFAERVEFVRGPSSIVYGDNGFGGTINTVLKSPVDKPFVELGVEGGDWNLRRADLDTSFGNSDAGVRVGAVYEDAEGWIDQVETEKRGVMANGRIALGEATDLRVAGVWQERDSLPTDQFTVGADGLPPSGVNQETFIGADWNRFEQKIAFGSVALTHELRDGLRLGAEVAVESTQDRNRYAYAFGPADPTGLVTLYGYRDGADIDSVTAQLSLGGDFEAFERDHQYLLFASYTDTERAFENFGSTAVGSVNIFDRRPPSDFAEPDWGPAAETGIDYKYLGASGQVLLDLTDRWQALVGARVDRVDIEQTDTGVVFEDQSFTEVVPRAGLTFKPSANWSIYGSYSRGFQPQFGRTVSDSVIDPEQGVQLEFGVKATLADGRVSLGSAVFEIERQDISARDPNAPPGGNFVIALGEQRHRGVELEAVGELVKGLNLIATYSYLDAEITEASNPAQLGNQPNNVPENSGSVFLSYAPQGGALAGFVFAAGASYRGERYGDLANTFLLGGHTTFDASISYRREQWHARLTVDNAFDKRYWDPYYNTGDYGLALGAPRRVTLRLGYRF